MPAALEVNAIEVLDPGCELSPEQKLWANVIRQAIVDLLKGKKQNAAIIPAETFILSEEFETICGVIGLHPDYIRMKIRKLMEENYVGQALRNYLQPAH